MRKALLLIFLIFSGYGSRGDSDFDNSCFLQDFAPNLITEVNFGQSNIRDIAKNLGAYIIYNQKKTYWIEYSDGCINFFNKAEFSLKTLPENCYLTIGGRCRNDYSNEKITESYMCNNIKCKKFNIDLESMFDDEIGTDNSNEIFNDDTFFDKVIEY